MRVAKWFGPPSETNFGGGYLAGDLPACEAAARAFAAAIVDVCARRSARRSARGAGEGGAQPAGARGRRATAAAGPLPGARDRRALRREARSPDPSRRRRVAGAEDAPAHRRARQAGPACSRRVLDAQVAADADGARALVGELGEILELARALVGAEVTGPRGPAAARCSGWPPTSCATPPTTPTSSTACRSCIPDVRQGPVVAKLSLARGDRARGRGWRRCAAFPADARRRCTAPPGARRSRPRAEPHLVGALSARLPLRRRAVRRQPPAARAGPRLEARPEKKA